MGRCPCGFVGRLYHGISFDPHFLFEDGKDFGTAVRRNRGGRQDIGLPVLKKLKHTTNIVLEPLGKFRNIVFGKQTHKIGGFGRITPQYVNRGFVLEDTRYLIACQKNRNASVFADHPFDQLLLRMGIGSIHLIQEKAHGFRVLAHQSRDAASVAAGLR